MIKIMFLSFNTKILMDYDHCRILLHIKLLLFAIVCHNQDVKRHPIKYSVRVTVYNATFNNISGISWWSVFLVEEIGVPGGNNRLAASHW